MANIKSAEKRIRQAPRRASRNRTLRSGARTAIKRARTALEGTGATSAEAVQAAIQTLDRAAAKGVIHPNNAARRKSRLMQALNKVNAAAA
jgi:small subunit ribosomal protein S20